MCEESGKRKETVSKMSKDMALNVTACGELMYPLTEKAVAIVNPSGVPFSRAVVGTTMPSANYRIKRGACGFSVFEYVIEGEGKLLIDGEWQIAREGDFYILAEGEAHEYKASSKDPWKKLWINYYAGYTGAMLSSYGVKSGVYRDESVKRIFDGIIEMSAQDKISEELPFLVADGINRIISIASRQTAKGIDECDSIKRRLLSLVYKKPSLDGIAGEFHMSKSNLIRTFKKRYGVTPYEYVLRLKTEAAKALLRHSDLSVKVISERLCFSDEHYFSTLFFSRVGKRPVEYRKG